MILFLLAALALCVPSTFGILPDASRYVRERAESDRAAAAMARELKALADGIQLDNARLAKLTAACLAGLAVPGASQTFAAQGQAIRVKQEAEYAAFRLRVSWELNAERRELSAARRDPGTCGVPGPLWLATGGKPLLIFENRLSGFRMDARGTYAPSTWKFEKASVRAWF